GTDIGGHSTFEMAMKVYGHVALDEKRAALAKLGTLFEEEKRPRCSKHGQRPHGNARPGPPGSAKAQVNGGYDLGFR
ncbi:MAG TPA: hypothetical protein VFP51_03925, partial [Nocardioidaceae bacterium]|nr:hypothetical protein [Nocardioidaceae bacterium]